jgi:hypothetical protein
MTMAAVTTSALALDLDPALPPYKAASGISGQLASVGSDTWEVSLSSGPTD